MSHLPFQHDDESPSFIMKHRRFIQAIFVLALVAYTTLLVYQTLLSQRTQLMETDLEQPQQAFFRNELAMAEQAAAINGQSEMGPHNKFRRHSAAYDSEWGGGAGEDVVATMATMKPPYTTLDHLFISVKTTKHYHRQRLPILLKTWFQMAKGQTWFFTDTDDAEFQQKTNDHMINTNCSSSHNRKALCCKMSVEFDRFIKNADKRWFCHFDDDNYVNVPRLVRFLSDYNPMEDWYLGKPSIQAPLEIIAKDSSVKPATISSSFDVSNWSNIKSKVKLKQHMHHRPPQKVVKFWFATGGAGFCLSRALALKMVPLASDGKFIGIGEKIRLPDDVTMGYIIEHLLKKPLTVVDEFHSHLEPMKFIRRDVLNDQISFSYAAGRDEWNVVNIDGFDQKDDITRFMSLHCFLFPYQSICPR